MNQVTNHPQALPKKKKKEKEKEKEKGDMVVHFVVDYSRNPILEPLNIGFRVRLDTTYFTEN